MSILFKKRQKNANNKNDELFLSLYALFMTLKTVKIPNLSGKVAKLDDSGKVLTVECASRNIAFRFSAPHLYPIKFGEWVGFSGKIRIDNNVNENKLHEECPRFHEECMYYHEPLDGSSKEEWLFFELQEVMCKRVGPPDVIDSLRECSNICRRFLDSWETNDTIPQLQELRDILSNTTDAIVPVLRQKVIDREEKTATVKAVDLGSV